MHLIVLGNLFTAEAAGLLSILDGSKWIGYNYSGLRLLDDDDDDEGSGEEV